MYPKRIQTSLPAIFTLHCHLSTRHFDGYAHFRCFCKDAINSPYATRKRFTHLLSFLHAISCHFLSFQASSSSLKQGRQTICILRRLTEDTAHHCCIWRQQFYSSIRRLVDEEVYSLESLLHLLHVSKGLVTLYLIPCCKTMNQSINSQQRNILICLMLMNTNSSMKALMIVYPFGNFKAKHRITTLSAIIN